MSQTCNDIHDMTDFLTNATKNTLLAYMSKYGDLDTYYFYHDVDYIFMSDGQIDEYQYLT